MKPVDSSGRTGFCRLGRATFSIKRHLRSIVFILHSWRHSQFASLSLSGFIFAPIERNGASITLALRCEKVFAKWVNDKGVKLAVQNGTDNGKDAILIFDITSTSSPPKEVGHITYAVFEDVYALGLPATDVPFIMLKPEYQGKRISPILWHHLRGKAQEIFGNALAKMTAEEVSGATVKPTKLHPVIGVHLGDPDKNSYWTRMGFDYELGQEVEWMKLRLHCKMNEQGVFPDAKGVYPKNPPAKEVYTRAQIKPSKLYGNVAKVWALALEDIEKGKWKAV
ncbi:hypothetical protein MMC24_001067 [Lignoscripta atroalba]|nr:hypothetical protein [Lignoscripta atroalba]